MTIMTRARCAAGLLVALGPGDTAITERGGATATQRGTGTYDGPSLNPQNPNGRKGRVGPELGRMDAEPQGSREGRGGDGLESRGKHGAGTAAGPRSGGAVVNLRRQTRRWVAQQRDRARGRRARHGIKGKTRGTVYVPKWQDVASQRKWAKKWEKSRLRRRKRQRRRRRRQLWRLRPGGGGVVLVAARRRTALEGEATRWSKEVGAGTQKPINWWKPVRTGT